MNQGFFIPNDTLVELYGIMFTFLAILRLSVSAFQRHQREVACLIVNKNQKRLLSLSELPSSKRELATAALSYQPVINKYFRLDLTRKELSI